MASEGGGNVGKGARFYKQSQFGGDILLTFGEPSPESPWFMLLKEP